MTDVAEPRSEPRSRSGWWSTAVRRWAVPVVILFAVAGGGLAMCGLPGDTLDRGDGIEGTYVVDGVDPVGSDYGGTVTIERDGDVYRVTWLVTGSIQSGAGRLDGDRFTVDWETVSGGHGMSSGTASYVVGSDGVLRGERHIDGVADAGTETIFPEP